MHGRLEHYPEFKAGVAQHIEETRGQQQMVEQCLGRFGEEPSALKDVALKLMGNMQAMVHGMTSDEVLKNLLGLYAFEHFEIAAYRSLIAIAEDCGESEVVRVCRQILSQEENAAHVLGALIEPVSRAYAQREAANMAASR